MELDPLSKCICGHTYLVHDAGDNWKGYCVLCFGVDLNYPQGQHKFRLDNLDYIEKEAEKRKLI